MPPEPDPPLSWLGIVFSDLMLRACAVFTLAFVLMPPDGLSLELCSCKRLTGAPCPGCGMTRCGSNFVRGEVVRGLRYHPFGALVVPLAGALGLLAVAPRRWRQAVRRAAHARARAWGP